MDNNPDNNPERQRDLDERRQLRRRITVTRPRAPLDEPHHELGRSNILYLLRVALLTRRNDGGRVELTATGAHFGIQHRLRRYTDKYAAKFGYTEEPARTRFDPLPPDRISGTVGSCLRVGHYWHPPELLLQMEHGLRNFLEREEVRVRLHSRETFCYPGNSNIFTERHEFVCTDEQGDRLFDLYDTFARHLDRGRRRAVVSVRAADLRRRQAIQHRAALMHIEHRRIYYERRDEYHRVEQAQRQELQQAGQPDHVVRASLGVTRRVHVLALQGLVAAQLADIARMERNTPRVNVRRILKNALLVAAQMNEPLE